MTTAMAVVSRTSQRAGPVSTGISRQFGSRGDSAALVSRLTQNTTRDDGDQRVEEDADVAAQHIVIVVEENRRDEEDADRQRRQQGRPERHRQAAEIGRILDRRIGLEDASEQAAPADQQHRGQRSAKKVAASIAWNLNLKTKLSQDDTAL